MSFISKLLGIDGGSDKGNDPNHQIVTQPEHELQKVPPHDDMSATRDLGLQKITVKNKASPS